MDYQPRLLKYGFGTLLGSLAVVALLVLPGRAGAADIERTIPYSFVPTPGSLGVGDNLAPYGSVGQSFLDHFTFTVGTNFTFNINNVAPHGIAFTGVELWSGLGATQYFSAASPFAVSSSPTLAAGYYDLRVSGQLVASSTGNFYSMGVNFSPSSAAPIPEPETYAMMLAGLGLMGFVAKRRKRKEFA